MDCMALSRFSKSYRVSPLEEMIGARQYIIDLIEMIKPKKVLANHGNHELRLGSYLAKNLDNELQELMPETALDYIFKYFTQRRVFNFCFSSSIIVGKTIIKDII